ncbi:cysteine-rich receptor-like protein kinase 42 [Cinnamomum micranthum f. kanehirae]|uniref:Cysteine-rich receptor-like protein kinase 42 n=1 Tax=Cinnamomum micranthum f. kanehirae TaxID=337451 RepID=A0A3S3N8V4_9MAGN|nr:cysteine-rich receptor-like protein kinase 42 [Cinnamomum micranthum f. kanehirae]
MRTKSSLSIFFSLIVLTFFPQLIASDPQTNLIKLSCSQYNTTSPSSFFSDLNATFSNIRSQLISATFATAQRNQIYTLFQCRPYLSTSDCLSCFTTAERQIRNCSAANGARVVYDGCYLRYESDDFFNQTTLEGDVLQCGGNRTVSEKEFGAAVDGLLTDLCKAAPRIGGLFAAGKRGVGVGGEVVYGVAQCVETVGRSGCEECLQVAYGNVKGCPPDVDGRAFDAGCFLRYSDTAFFGENQTTDLAPFLQTNTGESRVMSETKSSHSIFFSLIVITFFPHLIASDPQTNLIKRGCSQYNTTSPSSFSDLNATFSNIRSQLISSTFATAQSNQIYTLFQCRPYLSTSDCISCFSEAERQIRNCSAANGARVVYDGCYLRYESEDFFNQTTLAGNVLQCGGNRKASEKEFGAVVDGLLTDLCKATPRIGGLFAAGKRAVGVGGEVVYGVAQCVETVGRSGCEACLQVAYGNVKACLPDVDGRAFDAGCFLRYSDTAFFGDNQTTDLAPFLQTNTGISGGAAFILLILIIILLGRLKKIRSTGERDTFGATELRGPKSYHYNDLKFATRNFNEKCKLGEGGFGDVYKGVLKNGNTVAVKKLMISQSLVVREHFESEVKLISNVNHRNLVRLLGCCNKGPELLLVYEYMANSSLDKFLFAPEYAINGQLSEKVDTYSYGVVVLEIISGRKCSHIKTEPVTQYLLEWAWRLYEEDLLMELLDESLNPNEYSADEVKKVIQIALMCTQSPASRPTMSDVVVFLLRRGGLGISLNRPAFIDATNNRTFTRVHNDARTDTSTSTASSASNATVTISQLSAR